MTTIVTRAGKGSPLTFTEADANFTNLNNDKIETSAIGTTVQAYDAQLVDIAGLTPTDNGVVIGDGTHFVVESGATLKTSLGLTIGTDVMAHVAPSTSGNVLTSNGSAWVSSSGSSGNSVCDFVLTLESGVPISTTDQTAKTTIYCTPYKGNKISLYDGSNWITRSSAQFSLALGTLTASICYDVFCYYNAGTPTLEFLAWASATTRATGLTTQDGVLVKSGAATRRYMGTFYTASTTTTADAASTRYLWNYYNRVDKKLSGTVSVDRSIASATYVEVNAEVQIKYVIGWVEDPIFFAAGGTILSTGANVRVTTGITIDSTSTAQASLECTTPQGVANSGFPFSINGSIIPSVGYHYSTLIGMSEVSSSVSYIAATTTLKSKVYLTATSKR